MNTDTKQCPDCGETKPLDAEHFYRNKRSKNGFSSYCKVCTNARNKKWRDENPEQWQRINIESTKEWRKKNPEKQRELSRTQNRQWKKKNPEAYRAIQRRSNKKRLITHPDDNRRTSREYARRLQAAGGKISQDIKDLLYEDQGGLCAYCGVDLDSLDHTHHIDHVIPLSRGGTNDYDNLVCCCRPCNSSKGGKLLDEWDGFNAE